MVDSSASVDVASVDMSLRFQQVEMAALAAARLHDQAAAGTGNLVVAAPKCTLAFDYADTQRSDDDRCPDNSGKCSTDVAFPVVVGIVASVVVVQSFDCRDQAAVAGGAAVAVVVAVEVGLHCTREKREKYIN